MSSTRHEEAYHAARRCQATAFSLTPPCLHGLKKACQVEGEKRAGLFAAKVCSLFANRRLGSARRVKLASLLKGGSLIALSFRPESKENANPHISQGADGDGMTLAFGSFALIILLGP